MIRTVLSLLMLSISLICASPVFANENGQTLDQIVALVNDDVITQSELDHSVAIIKKQIQASGMQTPSDDAIRKEALQQIINRKLQLQVAKRAKISISNKELDSAIKTIAAQNNVTVSGLYQKLANQGLSKEDYRNTIRDQITMQRLQQQQLAAKISATPQEVDEFISKLKEQMKENKQYRYEEILIPLPDNPTNEQIAKARERAEGIYTKLVAGESFRQVLIAQRKLHIKPDLDAVDYGYQKVSDIPSAFAEKLLTMSKDGFSSPVQTANGFHILHLMDIKAVNGGKMPTDQQAREMLLQKKFETEIKKWLKELRDQSFIQITSDQS